MSTKAELYFEHQFAHDLEKVGQDIFQKYAPIIQQYNAIVIPFQRKRLSQNQSLVFENSSLERDKMELLRRIDQLKSENQRFEYSLEKQHEKINDLERKKEDLEKMNFDHISTIESLRISNQDYVQVLNHRDNEIKQVEKDKSVLLEKLEAKSGDYNILLANYMKDKNILAEKLNSMNQLQQSLLQKEKQLKAQQFYLKKQWQEFQEKTKKAEKNEKPVVGIEKKSSRIFGSKIFVQQQVDHKPEKNINCQILKSPLKKLVQYHNNEIYDLSFNYNGNILASCGGDRLIKIFDIANLRPATTIASSAENIFISIALNYNGDRLLAGSTDRTVGIFHTESGKLLHSFPGHGQKVNSIAWCSSKDKCVSGSDDKQMKVWDIEKATNILSVSCGKGVKVVRSNNVEPVVYTGHSDGSVRVYSNTQGTKPVSLITGVIDYAISSMTLMSNRNQVLVTSLEGSSIHILDLKMNKSVAKFENKDFFNSAAHAAISPSEGLVLAGNCDGYIYYWNRFKGEFMKRVSGHDSAVTAINYTFMNSMLASADKKGDLIIWQ